MNEIRLYISAVDINYLNFLSGKYRQLIEAVKKGAKSEEEIIVIICEGKYSISYYRNIKSRTLKILQALAIVSTPKGGNPTTKKLDNCRKFFTVGQKFLGRGERIEGIRLIKQAYRIAVDYDFTYLACELSSILYHNHVYYQRNDKKSSFYAKQVDKYLHNYTAEKKAEHLFYQILKKMHKSVKSKDFQEVVLNIKYLQGSSIKYMNQR